MKETNKKKPRVTEREKGRIQGLREAGLSTRAVAKNTGRCTHTVRRVTKPPPPHQVAKRPGPKPALSDREIRRLIRAAAKGMSSAAQLKTELQLTVSVRTIQRILARMDWLVYTKMVNTLPLKPEDMLKPKAWASAMLLRKDTGVVWDSIIFSDEKKWNLDGPDGFQHYWRDLRKPPRQTKRRQAGGGSVMVWAGFSARGKTPLVVLTGKQNSDDYVFTVSEYLLPFAHLNYGMDFIFQQDNASIHVSKRTKEFFSEQDIHLLDWPSKSPDLNPIENLWSIMSRRVYANGRQFDSVPQLKAALFEAWDSIPQALLMSLIESMPRRCIEVLDKKVLDKKGNKTHY